jgi:hypothetical protein
VPHHVAPGLSLDQLDPQRDVDLDALDRLEDVTVEHDVGRTRESHHQPLADVVVEERARHGRRWAPRCGSRGARCVAARRDAVDSGGTLMAKRIEPVELGIFRRRDPDTGELLKPL